MSTFTIPFPTSPCQKLCWAVVAVVWIALSFLNEMHVCTELNFLGGFTSASSGFTYQRILHSLNLLKRPELLEVGEGALSKLFAGKVYGYLGFSSVSSAATSVHAPFRTSHVSLPTSAVNAPSLAHVCGYITLSCVDAIAQRMLFSKKDHQERVTHEGSSNSPGSQRPGVL